MNYRDIKKEIEKIANSDYKSLIKAIISFELDIEDEDKLDSLYEYYIENDDVRLLSCDIYEKLKKVIK